MKNLKGFNNNETVFNNTDITTVSNSSSTVFTAKQVVYGLVDRTITSTSTVADSPPTAQNFINKFPNIKVGSSFDFLLRVNNTANANVYTFTANPSGGTLFGFQSAGSANSKNMILYRFIFTSLSPAAYSMYRITNYLNGF